ncbi:MFS transporter [Acinetobacter baumannii]|uniref:MFS transporter n=1 Tax=Acinetobacter baumannii TaxID=470 RepID=UPI0002789014|nr:MFS transporter [Acinetobacter baumannii]AVI35013.1 vacuole effluxer Atg22 like family protein [Acinetobacter baumannii]AVI37335.1 vacuole effluxer Atg22 like family protein [Acinetobacter baumannii]EHU1237349.1 MFS transporter [Acinetobacter baumannii]EHU1449309.1 MFS transporter [Acinetobacter baumannii]EHU1569204.1 MFS transporter [Acinetobacter baumannii]
MSLTQSMELSAEAIAEKQLIKKVAWKIMPLIMVCYLFAFFDRINISFAKFQLQADLSLSNTAYGLGASLFVIGYVIFEVPSNLLLHKFGARKWIARIMISWGVATALMVFVTTEWQFYVLRFLIGAMEAGFAPGVLYYMTLWFPQSYRGRIISLFFLASAFSGIFGGPISGVLLSSLDGVMNMRGWHWLFLVGGVPCVLLGLCVLTYLKDRIDDAQWLSSSEKVHLKRLIEPKQPEKASHSLWAAIKTPGLLILGAIYFLIQIASYGLNFWGPQLIKSSGIDDTQMIGFLSAIPYLMGAITMVIVGRLADKSGERLKFTAGLLSLGAIGFFTAGFFDANPVVVVISLALLGAGIVAAIPSFWNLPPKVLVGAGAGAAGGTALINTLGQVGGIVSPIMVGHIKDITGSTTPALYIIASLCVVCIALLIWATPKRLKEKG